MMSKLFGSSRQAVLTVLMAMFVFMGTVGRAAEYYVSPDGTGNGSIASPWGLSTALEGKRAQPGDVIYLRGGTYRGTYVSTITGSPLSPIVVKPYGRERVILDGTLAGQTFKNVTILRVDGGYVHFYGLEFTNSDPERKIAISGSNPGERRGSGFDARAPGVKLINSVIHDTGTGLSAYAPARDFEAYGNLIFNNGWQAPDRGHGHGLYTQNDIGTKLYRDNIILQQYGDGLHLYGSSAARLRNVRFTGNVMFFGRLLFGGASPLEDIVLEQNMTYNANLEIGYGDVLNRSVIIRNNYIGAGILFTNMKSVVMEGNTIFNHQRTNSSRCVGITPPANEFDTAEYHINGNTYIQCTQNGTDFRLPGKLMSFSQWQELGFDKTSTFATLRANAMPSGVKAFLRKNQYDADRAMLVIYNWERSAEVPVDVSRFLSKGDEYELRNAQDWFADPVKGVYDGEAINIRMAAGDAARPQGDNSIGRSTHPEAGVFLLFRVPTSGPRKPRVGAVINGASRSSGPVAPGSAVFLTGDNLGPEEVLESLTMGNAVAGSAAGVRVTFNGVAAPVLYSSTWEIAAIVPAAVDGSSSAEVRVETPDGAAETFRADIAPASPALYTMDGSGTGQAVALNEDGTVNGPDYPASQGGFLRLAVTGLGRLRNHPGDGIPASEPPVPAVPVHVKLGDAEVAPEFISPPFQATGPLSAGVWMRVRVPDSAASGPLPVSVMADQWTSAAGVTIVVK